jgi:hypothetical protein
MLAPYDVYSVGRLGEQIRRMCLEKIACAERVDMLVDFKCISVPRLMRSISESRLLTVESRRPSLPLATAL